MLRCRSDRCLYRQPLGCRIDLSPNSKKLAHVSHVVFESPPASAGLRALSMLREGERERVDKEFGLPVREGITNRDEAKKEQGRW